MLKRSRGGSGGRRRRAGRVVGLAGAVAVSALLLGVLGFGYGPRAAGGDPFTEDAADGGLVASTGPSWRMIVSLSSGGVTAQGVYPGGQPENPASPWYSNLVPLWWDGKYLPVPAPGRPAGTTTWSLRG